MGIKKVVGWMCLLCLMCLVLYRCGDSTPITSERSRKNAIQRKQEEKIRIEPNVPKNEEVTIQEKHTNINSHNAEKKHKPRTSLSRSEWQIINADEKWMENNMNLSGYKTYCTTLLNEQGTIDIVMTSGSFKDSASREAIDNYIGAAIATVGKFTSNAEWESRKLTIKVAFGEWHEISTSDCRKVVELFNKQLYQKASNYMFAHLKEIKNN
jgi:hypothetical protein